MGPSTPHRGRDGAVLGAWTVSELAAEMEGGGPGALHPPRAESRELGARGLPVRALTGLLPAPPLLCQAPHPRPALPCFFAHLSPSRIRGPRERCQPFLVSTFVPAPSLVTSTVVGAFVDGSRSKSGGPAGLGTLFSDLG